MEFRIYYDGGGTYSGDPFYAPTLGVLAIVQHNRAHGRRVTSNFDYFVWKDDLREWMGCDRMGMIDYLVQLGPKRVLIGRMVPKEYFYTVVKMANEDPDFPKRTAYYKEEVKV